MESKCKVVGFISQTANTVAPIKRKYIQRPLKVRLAPLLAKALKSKSL